MKAIFLQIYATLDHITQLIEFFHSDRPQGAIKNSMADLKEKIDALPDDCDCDDCKPLEGTLAPVEVEFLGVDRGTGASKKEE